MRTVYADGQRYFVTMAQHGRSVQVAWDCHWDPRENFPWLVEGEIAWLLRRQLWGNTVHFVGWVE